MGCRYCEGNRDFILNTHRDHVNIKGLIYRDGDYGFMIFVNGCSEAVFDFKYCPMCGRELKEMIQSEDLCVACGGYVVEGSLVCGKCKKSMEGNIDKAIENELKRRKMIREYEEKLKRIINNDDDQAFNFFEKIYCKNAIKILKDVDC